MTSNCSFWVDFFPPEFITITDISTIHQCAYCCTSVIHKSLYPNTMVSQIISRPELIFYIIYIFCRIKFVITYHLSSHVAKCNYSRCPPGYAMQKFAHNMTGKGSNQSHHGALALGVVQTRGLPGAPGDGPQRLHRFPLLPHSLGGRRCFG
jgi:hypothetical protein